MTSPRKCWYSRELPLFWFVCCIIFFVTIVPGADGSRPRKSNIDYLVPVESMVDSSYQTLLARNLYVSPANYLRIVIIPSSGSGSEKSIALYSSHDNTAEALLTCTQAERELWTAASELDPDLGHNPAVKIYRTDATFARELAESISKSVRQLIVENKEPVTSDRVVLHGTHVLFMVDDAAGRTIQGRLAPESRGEKTSALRGLTDALAAYCHSAGHQRAAQRKKIESAVLHLNRGR